MKEIFRTFTQVKVDILQQYRLSKPPKNPCNWVCVHAFFLVRPIPPEVPTYERQECRRFLHCIMFECLVYPASLSEKSVLCEDCWAQASTCKCVCLYCKVVLSVAVRLWLRGGWQRQEVTKELGGGRARQEVVSAPGSLTLLWQAGGRCVSLFWPKCSWEFTGHWG